MNKLKDTNDVDQYVEYLARLMDQRPLTDQDLDPLMEWIEGPGPSSFSLWLEKYERKFRWIFILAAIILAVAIILDLADNYLF